MKKTLFMSAAIALTIGGSIPATLGLVNQGENVKASSQASYVSNNQSSVSVTNIRKGSTVTLMNDKGHSIASIFASKQGTVTFHLTNAQLKQVSSKDVLAVKLSSGYKYRINFNFIGYKGVVSNSKRTSNANISYNQGVNGKAKQASGKNVVKGNTNSYSYVSNTSNSVSVTNIRQGSTVSLVNSRGQKIASSYATSAGTVTFYLNANQVSQLSAKDTLVVNLSSGYRYNINFNFIGYKATTASPSTTTSNNVSNGFVSGIPAELQGTWNRHIKLTNVNATWDATWSLSGTTSYQGGNDPFILKDVKYKALGNHTYQLQGIEPLYSQKVQTITVQRIGNSIQYLQNGTVWTK